MNRSTRLRWAAIAVAALGAGIAGAVATGRLGTPLQADQPRVATPAAAGEPSADEAAVRALARDFAAAFNKSDAKAVAAQWTEAGECFDAVGTPLIGRAAIEQAYAEFFKDNPQARIEVMVESIRFPAPGLAVEEGMLRQSGSAKGLPTTTFYAATHVRVGNRWQTAVSREWGAGQDRLEDLEWLIGKWTGGPKDQQVTMTVAREEQAPYLRVRLIRQDGTKSVGAGSFQIGLDPQSGGIRSWHFDNDGAIGQAIWSRDDNRWVLESSGVLDNGSETTAVDLISRQGPDDFTWQSTDRKLNDVDLPNTTPIRFTRVRASN
jgi:uncharacterized protein (TIGR02246 family)